MELKEELNKIVENYVDEMNEESNKEHFPIDVIEDLLCKIMADSKKIIVDKTEELIEKIDETVQISKKKDNIQRKKAFL